VVDPRGVGVKPYPSWAIGRARALRREMTFPERVLWKALRKPDLGFRRQAPIGRYVADFICFPVRLVVEVDGGVHSLPEVQLRDAKRDTWLKSEGYRVVRFGNERVLDDPEGVMATIRTLFPQGEKGRDEGERAALSEIPFEATPPLTPAPQHPAPTLTQPSPLEGEGSHKLPRTGVRGRSKNESLG
jgi:very-short-patch-repair endonuclease